MPAVAIFLFVAIVLTSIAPRKASAQPPPPSKGDDDLAKTVAKVVEQYIQGQNKPQK